MKGDSWRDQPADLPRTCQICGKPVRISDGSAFFSTLQMVSAHNACLSKYGIVRGGSVNA